MQLVTEGFARLRRTPGFAGGLLFFVPAYPELSRFTIDGVQYINGRPVAESVFGNDPFEPVKASYIPDIIKTQSDVKVVCVSGKSDFSARAGVDKAIFVFDAQSDRDIQGIAKHIQRKKVRLVAGCAGLAKYVPLQPESRPSCPKAALPGHKLVIISGSLNPITIKQIVHAMEIGIPCFNLTEKLKTASEYAQSAEFEGFAKRIKCQLKLRDAVIIGSVSRGKAAGIDSEPLQSARTDHYKKAAMMISSNIGKLFRGLVDREVGDVYLLIGGDTLIACMNALDCTVLTPLCEIAAGTVLTRADYPGKRLYLITKSGGLGDEDIINKTIAFLREENNGC